MGALTVSNVGKAYKRYPSKWARALEWLTGRERHQKTWVLRDISFTIQPGEAVGIIGVNGAGKSTLLKIITGTTQPTVGSVTAQGRVAALLELGMGFHPDFTGRQNVYMAGQLLGLSGDEITACMPAIEAFAEIGDYIDRPVRMYSSGMQMRLAFSVATAVRPDLLIVDEALSVGDVQFQQKCMSRIREFRDYGTTILLVTHDIGALSSICDRSVLLSAGGVIYDGPVGEGIEAYFASIARSKINDHVKFSGDFKSPRNYIKDFFIENTSGFKDAFFESEKIVLRLCMQSLDDFLDPHVGIRIQDRYGLIAFETNTFCQGINPRELLGCLNVFEVNIELSINLGHGDYTLAVGIENEGMPGGGFKSVILPTQVVHKFSVNRNPASAQLWAGSTNLDSRFGVKLAVLKN